MKLLILLPLVGAFAPQASFVRHTTARFAEARPDTSGLIKDAMAKAKEFGTSSAEARLAWEVIEEMDASSRTSDAMSLGEGLEECGIEATSAECIDYGSKLDAMAALVAEMSPHMGRVKTLAEEIKAIKLKPVEMPKGVDSPAIREALAAAKAASVEHGPTSSQAAVAWEELEEIASASERAEALGGKLGEECLTEMIEACEAIEELERVLTLDEEVNDVLSTHKL